MRGRFFSDQDFPLFLLPGGFALSTSILFGCKTIPNVLTKVSHNSPTFFFLFLCFYAPKKKTKQLRQWFHPSFFPFFCSWSLLLVILSLLCWCARAPLNQLHDAHWLFFFPCIPHENIKHLHSLCACRCIVSCVLIPFSFFLLAIAVFSPSLNPKIFCLRAHLIATVTI